MTDITKNQILATDNPNSWFYITATNEKYDISANQDSNLCYYVITAQCLKKPIKVDFWWQVLEYFESID